MGIDSKIFSEGRISRVLWKFALPAIISLLVSELYNMVDTFFVGRHVGANAIGALTIAFPIQRLLSSIGMLISIGTSTAVARYLGEKNYDELKKTISTALALTLGFLVVLPLGIYMFLEPILTKMGASSVIYPLARDYVSIILLGGIFQGLTFVMCFIMNSLGNTRVTLYTNSIGAMINVVIDFLLVSQVFMGVKGAAIATVISQIVAFIFAVIQFLKIKDQIHLKLSFKINVSIAKLIIAVGFSTFVIEISDAVVAVLLNNILSNSGGDEAIIIVGIITKVSMFMYITILGIASAMQPIVAFNYGARNFKRIKDTVKSAVKSATFASFAMWAVMMIFTKQIIGSFLLEIQFLDEAVRAFRICISLFPIIGLYYIAMYYYQAIGEAKMSFLLSIYRQIVIFIPLVIVFVALWQVEGAWVTYPITDIIASVTGVIYIRKANKDIEEERISYDKIKDVVNA